ncbi:MAG: OmpH family outer membrane protein [Sneathiella sp.]
MQKLSTKMKKSVSIFGLLVIGSVSLAAVNTASAQEKLPAAKVAVVDISQVLSSSRPWKEAEAEMKAQVKIVRDDIDLKRATLKDQADELKRQQAILAPEIFQQKVGALQQNQRNLQREMQVSNGKLNNVLKKVRAKLRSIIVKTSARVASEKGMNIGFDSNTILFFNDTMDITKEVLARFNASKTKIEIKPKTN